MNVSPKRKRRAAFTLIELLVVIAIIALLVSILLPSLRTARQLAMAALCSSNMHGLYSAGAMYSADSDGWSGPQYEIYYNPGTPVGTQAAWRPPLGGWAASWRPSVFYSFGIPYCRGTDRSRAPASYNFSPEMSVLDHYYVLGLVEGRLDYGVQQVNPQHVVCEVDVAMCPLARTTWDNISAEYGGEYGRVRASVAFSAMITSYPYWYKWTGDNNLASSIGVRNNMYGPYKPEELSDPSKTIWACDGMAMVKGGQQMTRWNPDTNAAIGAPIYSDVCFVRNQRFHHIAGSNTNNPWRLFGVISAYPDEENINGLYRAWEYYHENPAAVHWDGHTSNYSPPGDDNYSALRKNLSRDGTDRDDIMPK